MRAPLPAGCRVRGGAGAREPSTNTLTFEWREKDGHSTLRTFAKTSAPRVQRTMARGLRAAAREPCSYSRGGFPALTPLSPPNPPPGGNERPGNFLSSQ